VKQILPSKALRHLVEEGKVSTLIEVAIGGWGLKGKIPWV
jgi:hypothetical protein